MSKRLTGKTCVVTGGGTGIGLGVALALAEEGCRVAITGRRKEALEAACKEFTGEPRIIAHECDVGNLISVDQFFAWASKELGHVDILVNSAGVNVPRRKLAELHPDDWEKMMRINCTGAFYCIRAVLPEMRKRKDGLIVNISSIAGIRASLLGGVGYTASKFGMTGLRATVSREEAENGIRVTNIHPGEVETPILDNRPVPVSAEHRARILQPADVAAAVLMVACLPPRANVCDMTIKPTSQEHA